MRHGNLFVISGPSGAGKGTLVARLVKEIPDAWLSVSATTRPPRLGEQNGIHYHFVSSAEFQQLVENNGLLEWATYGDNRYGTLRASVEDHIAQGDQVILEIDVQGGFQVKKRFPNAHLVFIEPPSLEDLEMRLRKRGTEKDDEILARLKTAEIELSRKMEYDIRLVNDNLEKSAQALVDYVNMQAEKTRG